MRQSQALMLTAEYQCAVLFEQIRSMLRNVQEMVVLEQSESASQN